MYSIETGYLQSRGRLRLLFFSFALLSTLPACSTYPDWLPSSGPSKALIIEQEATRRIPVIDMSDAVARRVLAAQKRSVFSETFRDLVAPGYVVGPGDMLEVSVWEAAPINYPDGSILIYL